MAHDLIIRNGLIVDGTGRDGYISDIAIDGDTITFIGDLTGEIATREIDAKGLAVTPGFIDLHTHLDAQVGWDPLMTSSSWHGVTTVLMGNCGVTFAPVAKGDEGFLAEMMESVEDIPRDAILNGLAWDWESYPEYLDSVERMNPALNIVGMVGHCAVRYNVMGERSLTDEPATAQELQRMSDIVAESVAGGAVGFSTSRILLHVVPDGRYVPGTLAPKEEYLAIADGLNAGGGGIFQAVNDFQTKAAHEFDLLQSMSEACGDVLFSGGVGNGTNRSAEGFGKFLDNTRANSGRITSAGMTRPSGSLCGLAQISPVKGKKWRALMDLPTIEDRVAALRNASTRAELVEEGKEKECGTTRITFTHWELISLRTTTNKTEYRLHSSLKLQACTLWSLSLTASLRATDSNSSTPGSLIAIHLTSRIFLHLTMCIPALPTLAPTSDKFATPMQQRITCSIGTALVALSRCHKQFAN